MYTRKDYLNKKCTHREYYSQFVTHQIRDIARFSFGVQRLKEEFLKDENLNGIPLGFWDRATNGFSCNKAMMEHGDYSTISGKVCVLKEAARQIIEGDIITQTTLDNERIKDHGKILMVYNRRIRG